MPTIDDIKTAVSKSTGVPVDLLNGETEEEIRARAAALRAFAKQHQKAPEPAKSTAQQFAEWFDSQMKYDACTDPSGWNRFISKSE